MAALDEPLFVRRMTQLHCVTVPTAMVAVPAALVARRSDISSWDGEVECGGTR